MKIQRATFLGVRGVPDMTLDLTNPRTNALHDVVVFTGPSGSGKTRVLEALIAAKEALGAYGPMTAGAPWIASGQAAKIHLTFLLNEEEQRYAGTSQPTQDGEVVFQPDRAKSEADEGLRAVLERYTHEVGQGKLEYFPSSRHTTGFAPYGGLGPIRWISTTSSATKPWPRLINSKASSLFPTPLSPVISTPIPSTSSNTPCLLVLGARTFAK